jgi:CBS domain-containing protein
MGIGTSVSQIMTTDVLTVGPYARVPEVAKLLWEHGISGVPVIEGRTVLGMVTEFDLIAQETDYDAPLYILFLDSYFVLPGSVHQEQLRRILAITAGQLMTKPALTVDLSATVQDVATLMYERHVNPVPVVDDQDELVGIVSRSDIVRLMVIEEERHEEAEETD